VLTKVSLTRRIVPANRDRPSQRTANTGGALALPFQLGHSVSFCLVRSASNMLKGREEGNYE
jgi:hypothetical protein